MEKNIPVQPNLSGESQIWSPVDFEFYKAYLNINPSKRQELEYHSAQNNKTIKVDYNSNLNDFLKDSTTGEPVEVAILKTRNNTADKRLVFHFLSKDLKTDYGFASFIEHPSKSNIIIDKIFPKEIKSPIEQDYPFLNLCGSRYELETVQNFEPEKVKGITELAVKQLALKSALNREIPNIVCYTNKNTHVQNFKSGFRYLPIKEDSKEGKFFHEKYGCSNPNLVMKELLKNENTQINTEEWPVLGMYIPRKTLRNILSAYNYQYLKINSPFSLMNCEGFVVFDKTKPKKFVLEDVNNKKGNSLIVDYNPERTGKIFNKREQRPEEVNILKVTEIGKTDDDAYFFMSKDLKKSYGHVVLDKHYYSKFKDDDYPILKDYPEIDIVGNRVIVDWLENTSGGEYSGIGKLADKVAIKYCIENGLEPNIVSVPAKNSHMAHYKRGKRFIPPIEGGYEAIHLENKYGTSDPNKILERMLQTSILTGQEADVSDLASYIMYLPKELVKEYMD